MRALIRAQLALLVLLVFLACSFGSLAAEIRTGATMRVKPDSIWFEETTNLTRWQQLKNGRNRAALKAYQEQKLGSRDAWQFLYPMEVKILGYEPKTKQVRVEMLTEGRFLGTQWVLDAGTLMQKRTARP